MDELYMFIGLVALQDKTSMRVCPGSHRSKSFIDVLRVDLNKYEYIVCHPKLIHSGCGADEANYRLHFYHGIPEKQSLQTSYPDILKTDRAKIMAAARSKRKRTKKLKTIAKAREAKA
jgi:hypothetical protein